MPATIAEENVGIGWFLVSDGGSDSLGATLPIPVFPCLVGRQTGATIRLINPTISRAHAELVQEGELLRLRDLGSSNGTFRNGKRVESSECVEEGDLLQFGNVVFRLLQRDNLLQPKVAATCAASDLQDLAFAIAQFDRLFQKDKLIPHYQPIVTADDHRVIGFEVLARSRVVGLANPQKMFQAAAQLSRSIELSELLRISGVEQVASDLQSRLYLNTHPAELGEPKALIASLRALRKRFPDHEFSIEIHEAAKFDTQTIHLLRFALTDLGMELAFDDFGAGESRLLELVEAQPDCLKFDMRLIRNLHKAPASQRHLLEALVSMAREMNIRTLAEGVESLEEAIACQETGFDLYQGYYFGRPQASQLMRRPNEEEAASARSK
jgi:EAL domain-containing protein (putative c-di-GMP-specific phosphodiesterase class I)